MHVGDRSGNDTLAAAAVFDRQPQAGAYRLHVVL